MRKSRRIALVSATAVLALCFGSILQSRAADPPTTPRQLTEKVVAEALAILRGCNGIDVVGADVVEVAPSYDPTNITAQAGAQVLFTSACLAVEALKRRRG